MAEKTVTKRDLAKALAKQYDLTQMQATEVIQTLLDEVITELSRGNRLELRNFGVFEPRLRRKRKARNPRTNQPLIAEARATVSFKVGKEMKKQVQKALSALKAKD